MGTRDHHSMAMRQIDYSAILALIVWSMLCGTAMFLIYLTGEKQIISSARIAARTSIDKDIAYRHWLAGKGGVYAEVGRNTPPNPYLKVDEREITTSSGRQLTLVNPAYMTRQVFEQKFGLTTSVKSHITSLNPLRPENLADTWETEALTRVAQGAEEYGTPWQHEGKPTYRYLRPLIVETACLQCHAAQGYQEGDIRGGISVIVPLEGLLASEKHQFQQIAKTISGVWLVGLFGIGFSWRRTVQKTAELQQERDNMQLLFESAPTGMLLFNREGKILMENAAFRQKHCRAESLPGERLGTIFNCQHSQADPQGCGYNQACLLCPIFDALKKALDQRLATHDRECVIQTSCSETAPLAFLFSVTPLLFGGEEGALLVLTDISEQRSAEQERERLGSQLLQAQKIESIGRLAGGVAHDFNNMLSIISGNVELALRKLDSKAAVKSHLGQIKETTNRSANLTRQLLGFARKQMIMPQVLNLNDSIEDMLKMLRRLIGEDIELIWKPAPLDLQLLIDPSQLDQILTNLVVNARDAIATTGTLALGTDLISIDEDYHQSHLWSKVGDYVQLSVSDDGCGMSKEIREHIFEPFYTTKAIDKGTGLGLATVYGIVKQNHGFINAYSEPGHGSTFCIYLPQWKKKTTTDGEFMEKVVAEETIAVESGKTILLVEDEERLLEIGQRILEDAGYRVIASSEPLVALQLAVECRGAIDLLLTDVIMPKMNGRELAKQLLSLHPEAKVAYMSGYSADIVASRGLLDEGVLLLQKPFTTEALTQKLSEALQS